MLFKELKTLITLETAGSTIALPKSFTEWQLLIKQSIKKIADEVELESLITNNPDDTKYRDIYSDLEDDETDYFLKEPVAIGDESSKINIEENLTMAVVYDIAVKYQSDFALKQKNLIDKDTVIADYLWNKFKAEEMKNYTSK